MNEITEITARNLRLARENAGLTRPEMAERMECHPNALYLWESGKREIGHETLCLAAKILGKSWLWFYQDQATATPEAKPQTPPLSSEQEAALANLQALLENEEIKKLLNLKIAVGDNRLTKWPPYELAGIQSVLTSARAQRALFAETARTGTSG